MAYFREHLHPSATGADGDGVDSGQWLGGGAEALGLMGDVAAEDLACVLIGVSPDRRPLVQNPASPTRRAGWDLVFSSPKSLSILWALGPPDLAGALDVAHQQAAQETLHALQDGFATGRRGKAGRRKEPVRLVAALFEHYISRENDPQRHTHALVANLARFTDGHWGALEPRPLFQGTLTLGLHFRQALAGHLQPLGLPLEWEGNQLRIASVPRDLEREFSRRRIQIERRLEQKPHRSAKAKEIAALETRRPKEAVSLSQLRPEWRQRAAALGLLDVIQRQALGEYRSPEPAWSDEEAWANQAPD